MKKKTRFLFLSALIPLSVGFLFYLLYCPETYLSGRIRSVLPVGKPDAFPMNGAVVRAFRCWGLDALWAYALVFTLTIILGTEKRQLVCSAVLSILLEIMTELTQYLGWTSGTFDPMDIAAEISATLLGLQVLCLYLKRKEKKNEKEKNHSNSVYPACACRVCGDGDRKRIGRGRRLKGRGNRRNEGTGECSGR